MESWISNLAAHGYAILFATVFLEAVGLPVPAALALLIAGGASATGPLQGSYVVERLELVHYRRSKLRSRSNSRSHRHV
jgi:hypothetical protein